MADSSAGKRTLNDSASTLPPQGVRAGSPNAIQQILDDQRQSWLRGHCSRVEDYLQWMPHLASDHVAIVELLVGEFRLRQELGEVPLRSEFEHRFPEHAARLKPQLVVAGIEAPGPDHLNDQPPATGPGGTVIGETELERTTHVGDSADSQFTIDNPTEHGEAHRTESPTSLIEASEALARELAERQASGRAGSPDHSTIVQLLKEALKGSSQSRVKRRSLTPLRAVPGYDILAELGRGSVGVVYKARQAGLNRVVALKMILAGGHASRTTLARFRAEAEAVASLQHGNIVQVYDIGECDGLPFFSLEFCAGGSLADRLDGTPLPPETAARTVVKLARAMHYAHGCRVVHRDLKPGNILLHPKDDAGRPAERTLTDEAFDFESIILKVSDFGLAKRLDEESQTKTGAILGTPSYMAPEQASGKIHDVGPLADIYALGAVLYELLTGRPPFRAATPLDTVVQVIHDEPVPPRRLHSGVPADLETIALKCLQKDPLKRYATAADLADDLQRFLDGEPIVARPIGMLERTWRWCQRNPVVAGLSALAATLLVVGTVVSLYFAKQATERAMLAEKNEQQAKAERETARRNQYVAEMNLVQRAWRDVEMARVRAASAQIPATETTTDFRGPEWHYWNRLANAELAVVPVEIGDSPCLALSSDGLTAAAAGTARTIVVWNVADWRELTRFTGHSDSIVGLAFLADGRLVSTGPHGVGDRGPYVKGTEIRFWSVSQRMELESHIVSGDAELEKCAVSPDGTRIALADRHGTVTVAKLGDGSVIRSFDGTGVAALSVTFAPDSQRLAAGFGNGDVTVWNIDTGIALKTYKQPHSVAHCVAFSPDGRRLAIGGSGVEENDTGFRHDGDVRVMSLESDRIIAVTRGHLGPVLHLEFSRDGRRLLSGGNDRTIRIWDALSGNPLAVHLGHERSTSAAVFGRDSRLAISAGDDHMLRVWDASILPEQWPLTEATSSSDAVGFGPDGSEVAMGISSTASGSTVAIHELPSNERLLTFPVTGKRLTALTWHPIVSRIAVATEGDAVSSVGLRNAVGVELWKTNIASESITGLAFSPSAQVLAVSGRDRVISLDATSGGQIAEFRVPSGHVADKALLTSGEMRVVSLDGSRAFIWDSSQPTIPRVLEAGPEPIVSATISRDGSIVATASADRTIQLWNAVTGIDRFGRKLTGHVDKVAALTFSPDGRRLASAGQGYDHTTRIWDTANGQELLVLSSSNGEKPQIKFSDNGHWLAVCRDRPEFWDCRPVDVSSRAERSANAVARHYSMQPLERDAAVAALSADGTIDENMKRTALSVIQQWSEFPLRFELAAWTAVRSAYGSIAEYDRAVGWARHSTVTARPHGPVILGAALFRAGRYEEANTILVDGSRIKPGEDWDRVRRVFLAMTGLHFGRVAEAKDTLVQLERLPTDDGLAELIRELRERVERIDQKMP